MADWSVPTERENNLALAAGAKPGETVTINGNRVNVIAPTASPKSPKKPDNKRLDDHPEFGDGWLIRAVTDAVGNYFGKSLDVNALGTVKGIVNQDGTYSARTTNANGDENRAHHGARKTKAASETKTVAGHKDSGVGGGTRSTVQKGTQTENNGAETAAVNGPSAKTTAQSAKTFAQGGNGPQRIKGDYSLSSEEGSIHFEANKNFTVTAKGDNIGLSTKTGTITFTAGKNKIIISPRGITIHADVGPVLMYAKAGDVHIAGKNYVSVQSYTKDVTVTTPGGKIDLNP